MPSWIDALPLTATASVLVCSTLALATSAAAVVGTLRRSSSGRRSTRVSAVPLIVGALVGAGIGLLAVWMAADVLDLFGADASAATRAWAVSATAVAGLGTVALLRGRHRVLASVAIVTSLLAGAVGVNSDIGEFPTVGALLGQDAAAALPSAVIAAQRDAAGGGSAGGGSAGAAAPTAATPLWSRVTAGALPAHGTVGTVVIPGTVSHFPARPAYVYLPPAALVAHPVALPVLIMLSGQPGSPADIIRNGALPQILDAWASAHDGLAPIVVVPDQLGQPEDNPMCVDGALGDSATYLTRDVPAWIRGNLHVEASPGAWAIGGFSQGGTCAIQLGAGQPELFSGILDISGQLAPQLGTLAATVAQGFAGDDAAYDAARPLALLAAHAPYRDTTAVFAVGDGDGRYGPGLRTVADAARAAGMATSLNIAPGSAHDWRTVGWALRTALDPLYIHLGLERP